jgi:anhydro-N-acetylmuramic acid kinase
MAQMCNLLNVPVMTAEDAGWAGDFIEAEAFAFLAVRSANGLSLSLPSTTGVAMPMTGGRFHRAVPRSRPFNAPDWGRSSGG